MQKAGLAAGMEPDLGVGRQRPHPPEMFQQQKLQPQQLAPVAVASDFLVSQWIPLSFSPVKGHGPQWALELTSTVCR